MHETEARRERVEAVLRPTTRFGWLLPGERFRFPGTEQVLARTACGYQDSEGRRFRTGSRTSVIRINEGVQ